MKTATDILDRLNQLTGKRYQYKGKVKQALDARIDEYSADEIMQVVEAKHSEWSGSDMEKYLRPATLFGKEKCEEYVGALISPDSKPVSRFESICKAYDCPLPATNSGKSEKTGGLCTWHNDMPSGIWQQITSRIKANRQLIAGVNKLECLYLVDLMDVRPQDYCDIEPCSDDPREWKVQLEGVLKSRIWGNLERPVKKEVSGLAGLIANTGIMGRGYEQD